MKDLTPKTEDENTPVTPTETVPQPEKKNNGVLIVVIIVVIIAVCFFIYMNYKKQQNEGLNNG